jgi:uncharacterized protein YukJ
MTRTTQFHSQAVLNDTHQSIINAENGIEDNNRLLLSIADSMNDLCEKLSRLEYVLKRKNVERILYPEGKGERNED